MRLVLCGGADHPGAVVASFLPPPPSIHPSDKHARPLAPAAAFSSLAVGEGVTSKVEDLFMSLALSLSLPPARSTVCAGGPR